MNVSWGGSVTGVVASPADFDFGPEDAAVLLRRHTEILELVAHGASRRLMLDRIVTAIEGLIPESVASILIYDRSGERLRHGSATRLPSDYLAAIDGIVPGPSAGSCGTAAYLNERVIAEDVMSDLRWRGFRGIAHDAGLAACWSTPIGGRDGRPVGTFAVYHREPHRPTPRELRLVDRFSYLASVVIEHTRVRRELIENEELFRRSFEDNAASMLLLDPDLRVTRVNNSAVRLTGFTPGQLVGRPVTSFLHGRAGEGDLVDGWLTVGLGPVTHQVTVTTRDGAQRTAEATASAICEGDEAPTRLIITLLDLTEREAAARAERARREAEIARTTAEQHSQAKSALLTTVSHEIRSPLQSITGFTELLSTLDLDEDRRGEALRQINVAAQHLLGIVTDVLDMTKVEAAALPLRLETVHLRRAVEEALDLVAPLADARDVRLHVEVVADEHALADARRVVQILLNLLRNAVQHGAHGGRVRVDILHSGQSDDRVVVQVNDDGPGIPEDMLATVFSPWVHDPNGADGFGLGLGLASRLAEAMNGTLTATQAPEGGARFELELPRAFGRTAG